MTSDEIKTDLTIALMSSVDGMSPIFDAADGIKAELERRGWSPTASEQAAQEWLLGAIRLVWKVQG